MPPSPPPRRSASRSEDSTSLASNCSSLKPGTSESNLTASTSSNIYSDNRPPAVKPRQISLSSTTSSDCPPPSHSPPRLNSNGYENVWMPEDEEAWRRRPVISASRHSSSAASSSGSFPPQYSTDSSKRSSNEQVQGATALPESASSPVIKRLENLRVGEEEYAKVNKSGTPASLKNVGRSSSTSNLANFAKRLPSFSKIGRKISDQVMKPSIVLPRRGESMNLGHHREEPCDDPDGVTLRSGPSTPVRSNKRRSSLLESSWPGTQAHCGPLKVYSKSKRGQSSEKWTVLANASISYFNQKDSMAEPKENILLKDVLSVNKRTEEEADEEGRVSLVYCFDLAFMAAGEKTSLTASSSKQKMSIRTFGTASSSGRDVWIDKITQSLSYKLDNFSTKDCSKLGWVYLKIMFGGEWHQSWISLKGNFFFYTLKHEDAPERVDLKKVKNVTLIKDIKNLNAPENVAVLVVDFTDRSLYLQARQLDECRHWKSVIEEISFDNGNSLAEQQMTKDDLPVVVEECVNFVYRHGCLTEGIYRHSGVKTKIDRILADFGKNAWNVRLTRDVYSEHDVANALKRFMRTLDEPLLTESLRSLWMAAARIPDLDDRLAR